MNNEFEIIKYPEWEDTKVMLHSISQMIGKIKLKFMEHEPEWFQSTLDITTNGFSSGLITNGSNSFSIDLDLSKSLIVMTNQKGDERSIVIENYNSISAIYFSFIKNLKEIIGQFEISDIPQEMDITTPFNENHEELSYSASHAKEFHEISIFVRNNILKFVAPFRGKKIKPILFWGTFDITGILYFGKENQIDNENIIERVAFDEELIEFGFWMGDKANPNPMFFVLAYDFLGDDIKTGRLEPEFAIYDEKQKEFFIKLEDVLSSKNPELTLSNFFKTTYSIITDYKKYDNLDWLNKPLKY